MKNIIKKLLNLSGYEIRKIYDKKDYNNNVEIGSDKRPVGSMNMLLEDLKNGA